MVNISEDIAKALVEIIDVSAKSGAFTGANLTVVGTVRAELVNAITSAEAEKATEQ